MANSNFDSTSYELILKQAAKRKRVFSFQKAWPAFFVLIVMLVISYFIWQGFKDRVENDQQYVFEKAVNSVMNRFEAKKQSLFQVLTSMQGIYYNKSLVQVTYNYFTLYSSVSTKADNTIVSIIYAQRVEPGFWDLNEFLHFTRSMVQYLDYNIKPPGIRNYYYPIQYIEPFSQFPPINMNMIGFDLATIPSIDKQIEKARDLDTIVATPILNIREKDTLSFFLMAPIYQKGLPRASKKERERIFEGLVILEADGRWLFEEALGDTIRTDTTIIFQCYDINQRNEKIEIFASKNKELLKTNYIPYKTVEKEFKIADKVITIKFQAIPNFAGVIQTILPTFSLIASLILSFIFFGFILSITTSKARAVDLAERMTRSQRRIVESSKDMIAVLDLNGIWKTMNSASKTILGIEPFDLIGKQIDNLFFTDSDKKHFYSLLNKSENEYTERHDYRMLDASGNTKWISWSFTISSTDQLIYCIGRDVTLEKIIEEQNRIKTKQIQLAEQFTKEASEFKTYFMAKLSHQMRNGMTGIIGYLQLLSTGAYESVEEHDNFINLALQSSEEMFSYLTDLIDVTLNTSKTDKKQITNISINQVIERIKRQYQDEIKEITDLTVNISPESNNKIIITDVNLITLSFKEAILGLSKGIDKSELQIECIENPYENTLEIQILSNPNPLVSKLIGVYKDNTNNIIEAIQYDKEDIIFHLAISASTIRMMNGFITFDTLGPNEGNVVQISMPLNKT